MGVVEDVGSAVGHHADRLERAKAFGTTDLIAGRDLDAAATIIDLTRGDADHVLECVGAKASMDLAIQLARSGGTSATWGFRTAPPKGVST